MIPTVMPTYARADIVFEKGDGMYLFATDGRRYLDFGAGVAVNSLGHAHPHLVAALKAQAEKLWHCSNLYRVAGQEKVSKRLVEHTFADTVFFCNSGAEAMEGVIKLTRKYQYETGHHERYRIVVPRGAFHGRTLATIAAGGQEKHLKGFGPVVDGFDHVTYGDIAELRAAIGPQTAGILVEPIQGEGGIVAAKLDYLRAVRAIADEFGLLLAMDEVQTGNGRTGKLYAHEWAGITPDVMGTAKGLGGGFPIGAILATEKAAVGMTAGTHGSTFGGNPLAMAAADAVLDILLSDGFLEHVRQMGALLWDALEKLVAAHPQVLETHRGAGLMQGLKCKVPSTALSKALLANGLLTVGAGDNVIRFVPPLIVEPQHIAEAVALIDKSCKELAA
ncbi:aspartate aminotransferase family protein [Telmatospirillum sp.]|uniref:aspartate aminotransferase family protein n=1 Tax=Telmatospirillum sp. TaxID=2079197 RepID=UPI002840AA6C|nr:aspartate aminotransferase family protein [Telmatospirillum sp.]MDR3441258.1 aspartate aminotransferase family protein [Telmatospirillum sp.]